MRLRLKRHWFTNRSSMGVLMVDDQTFSFTLEDVARADGVKIDGETCIPAGEYRVTLDFSQRFQAVMPHILDVPMFEGIRIHKGNAPNDTGGCILVGYAHGQDLIWDSRKAYDDLMVKLQAAYDKQEQITLVITNEQL